MSDSLDIISKGNDLLDNNRRVRQQMVQPSAVKTGEVADNSITAAKIKSITWDKAFGGTLTLGGASNVNGLEQVKNAAGSTVVQLDNAGITVTGGNILVKNNNAQTILDTSGIVSSVNFPNSFVVNSSTNTTTSASLVDLPGSTLSNFTLARNTVSLIIVNVSGLNGNFTVDGSRAQVAAIDSIDGTIVSWGIPPAQRLTNISQDGAKNITGWTNSVSAVFSGFCILSTLSAGTHTLKMQYMTSGTGTAEVDLFEFGYVLLGS